MKIGLEIALAQLALNFALPTFAQEKDASVDPRIVQQLHAIGKKSDEAFLRGDAVSLAALFTEDAILVNDTGPIYGREAIEKYYANMFQIFHYFTHDTTYDPSSLRLIGTDGNSVWENGEWSSAIAPKGRGLWP
jgi:ketosteroid isomerase-like protein